MSLLRLGSRSVLRCLRQNKIINVRPGLKLFRYPVVHVVQIRKLKTDNEKEGLMSQYKKLVEPAMNSFNKLNRLLFETKNSENSDGSKKTDSKQKIVNTFHSLSDNAKTVLIIAGSVIAISIISHMYIIINNITTIIKFLLKLLTTCVKLCYRLCRAVLDLIAGVFHAILRIIRG